MQNYVFCYGKVPWNKKKVSDYLVLTSWVGTFRSRFRYDSDWDRLRLRCPQQTQQPMYYPCLLLRKPVNFRRPWNKQSTNVNIKLSIHIIQSSDNFIFLSLFLAKDKWVFQKKIEIMLNQSIKVQRFMKPSESNQIRRRKKSENLSDFCPRKFIQTKTKLLEVPKLSRNLTMLIKLWLIMKVAMTMKNATITNLIAIMMIS